MIHEEFLLETMHGKYYPDHPLWKHMLAIVLAVKARGENQYIAAEYSVNSLALLFFFRPVFPNCSFYMGNCTHDYTNVVKILTLCHFFK